jgi:rare lipoprotein A (peptidoglycan hydrolase)/chorismate mutase
MRPSTSPAASNVATRRIIAAVAVTACVLLASIPRVDAADTSLAQLRTQRAALVTRIARLTDALAKAQATADAARERRFIAELAADEARQQVARHAVDTYVGSVEITEVERLRRTVFGTVAASADRSLRDRLRAAKEDADRETSAAEAALADTQRTVTELETARAELEKTISEREAAEAANAAARAANTSEAGASTRPRYARTTASQRDLFARYPFGAVDGIPEGLVTTGQTFAGNASWYGPGFDGRPTASGAIFDQEGPTVAHRTLPLGTILLLRRGDRTALVLVNDRGPFVGGRVLDLSHGVAKILGTVQAGVAHVTAEILVPA